MIFGLFKKKDEPISWFEGHDAEMLSAIHKAQASFHEFITAIEEEGRRIVPAFEEALVKYAFPATTRGVKVEHMFLSDIQLRNGVMVGTLAGEPLYTSQFKEGQVVEIDPSRVSDWLYVVNGSGIGGFTFRVMWTRFNEKEKSAYRSQPPFVWLSAL